MLSKATETLESGVGAGPRFEAWRHGRNHILQGREVLVVQAAAADQFPDALDRIEFRAVRRQKGQLEVIGDLVSPGGVQAGVMIPGVVTDHHHLLARPATLTFELPQEIPAGACIKHAFGPGHDELAVPQAHRAEEADAFAGWGMKADWVGYFGRHPHSATRTMLLEMNLIQGPKINARLLSHRPEFFYACSVIRDRRVQSWAWACGAEILTAGRVAGTVEY